MRDGLGLLDFSIPLQQRYDIFLLWLKDKNYAVSDFIAGELGLKVSEVDVFSELGNLEDDEFAIIDEKGFDIGHLFLILRTSRRTRNIIYLNFEEILSSSQPLNELKVIVDQNSNYSGIEELVKKISGTCWMKIASYLRQRDILDGTINKGIRSMLVNAGRKANAGDEISEKMIEWIIRAINHDKIKELGVFTNETIRLEFFDDYNIINQIRDSFNDYENDK